GPGGDLSAVVARDVLDDRQAQPGAAGGPGAGAVDPEEALEDAFQVLLGDAHALVLDGDLDHALVPPDGHPNPGALVGVGDRVGDQVGQRGGEHRGGAEDLQPVRTAHGDLDPRPERVVAVQGDRALHHLVDLDRLRIRQCGAALDAGELDDLLHQVGEAVGLALHARREPAHRL